jgi:uncharacterized glyoxalase superfamily protein PhnB
VIDGSWWVAADHARSAVEAPRIRLDHAFSLEAGLQAMPFVPAVHKPAAIGGREAGSRFQLTIWVDDADVMCKELATRGVELLNGPMNREWGMRTASFTDPDGHIWQVAAKLPEAERA